jgi:hypothetical protein
VKYINGGLLEDKAGSEVCEVEVPEEMDGLSIETWGSGYHSPRYCKRGVSEGFGADFVFVIVSSKIVGCIGCWVRESVSVPCGVPVSWGHYSDGETQAVAEHGGSSLAYPATVKEDAFEVVEVAGCSVSRVESGEPNDVIEASSKPEMSGSQIRAENEGGDAIKEAIPIPHVVLIVNTILLVVGVFLYWEVGVDVGEVRDALCVEGPVWR